MAYSILAALATPSIKRLIVSTDDERIAETAIKYGAEVPFLRPSNLATDDAIIGKSIGHVLDELRERENYRPQAVGVLYPTTPFRDPAVLDFLIQKLFKGYRKVLTVKKIDPSLVYYYDDGRVASSYAAETK